MYLYIFLSIVCIIAALAAFVALIAMMLEGLWGWAALWLFVSAGFGTLFALCLNQM